MVRELVGRPARFPDREAYAGPLTVRRGPDQASSGGAWGRPNRGGTYEAVTTRRRRTRDVRRVARRGRSGLRGTEQQQLPEAAPSGDRRGHPRARAGLPGLRRRGDAATACRAPRATTAPPSTSRRGRRRPGMNVTMQEFEYQLDFLADYSAPILAVGGGTEFVGGIAGATLRRRLRLDVQVDPLRRRHHSAPVWAIDLAAPGRPAPNTSTSGCEAADFAGVPAGAIVIIQRGHVPLRPEVRLRRAPPGPARWCSSTRARRAGPIEPLWFNFDGDRHPDVRGDRRDRHRVGQRRAQRRHRAGRALQDRLATRHLHDDQRDRRDAPAATRTT